MTPKSPLVISINGFPNFASNSHTRKIKICLKLQLGYDLSKIVIVEYQNVSFLVVSYEMMVKFLWVPEPVAQKMMGSLGIHGTHTNSATAFQRRQHQTRCKFTVSELFEQSI